jgi:uncharacterized damage-inducible protein DinB
MSQAAILASGRWPRQRFKAAFTDVWSTVMSECARIRDQIVRSLSGEAWHGAPIMEVLSHVDAQTAWTRPIPGAHTIWEIVLHLTASVRLVSSRMAGEPKTLSPEEDWPQAPAIPDILRWESDVASFREAHQELLDALSGVDDAKLDEPIVPGFSSLYVTLQGLVQHNLYHAGQIALLGIAARE